MWDVSWTNPLEKRGRPTAMLTVCHFPPFVHSQRNILSCFVTLKIWHNDYAASKMLRHFQQLPTTSFLHCHRKLHFFAAATLASHWVLCGWSHYVNVHILQALSKLKKYPEPWSMHGGRYLDHCERPLGKNEQGRLEGGGYLCQKWGCKWMW